MDNGSHFYGAGFTNRSKPQNDAVWDLWPPTWINNNNNNTPTNNNLFTSAADGSISSMYSSPAAANNYEQLTLYNGRRGGANNLQPDSHLMCLKLGKRHYFGDNFPVRSDEREADQFSIGDYKRVKPYVGPSSAAAVVVVPRCQVEGCYVSLVDAKDYHRRHKVCEMHSKAPNVVVLGLQQRFCQQCSRFHVVSEFDESKRSCRRRLAGHNERRRKGNQDSVIPKNSYHATNNALSLLSSKSGDSWDIYSSSDLSSRSSAALRELIAQHRGSILPNYNELPNATCNSNPYLSNHPHHQFLAVDHRDRFQDDGNEDQAAVTLDLMQAPTASAPFGYHKDKEDENEDEEECSVLWNSW